MSLLLDTCVWIKFFRASSSLELKQYLAPFVLDIGTHLAEPITFEILRHTRDDQYKKLAEQFSTFPSLRTPEDLWERAIELGRKCRSQGLTAGSIDLLIATLAAIHEVELMTFDADFQRIAAVDKSFTFGVKLLVEPGA